MTRNIYRADKKIRHFCKQVKNNLKEPYSVKLEVEEELYESIKDKMNVYIEKDFSPEIAVELAIREYESPQSVLTELANEYKIKKYTKNTFLTISILLFLIGSFILGSVYCWNKVVAEKEINRITQAMDILALKGMKNQSIIPTIVDENQTIEAIWISIKSSEKQSSLTYVYPEYLPLEYKHFKRENNIFYQTTLKKYSYDNKSGKLLIKVTVAQLHANPSFSIIGITLILLSLSLAILWVGENYRYRNPRVQKTKKEGRPENRVM
ncbi:MAG: hypothetical protein ABF649_17340 [Bacillus sp. (in: firmicutes)]